MALEINRNTEYTYRINPYAATEIDRRKNRHNARWEFVERHRTPEEARAALLQLETEDTDAWPTARRNR